MSSNSPVELLVALHVDRGGAGPVLVSNDGENRHAKWIGRKLIGSLHTTGQTTKGTDRNGQSVNLPLANITIPEWLALKEGFI